MVDYERNQWLAIRDRGSLGQCLRSRSRFIHISKTAADCETFPPARIANFGSRRNVAGRTLNIGRNVAKRARKVGARKYWRPVPKVGA